MPLFGFSDITFNKDQSGRNGPLSSLELTPYTTTTLRYPADLGNWDKSHYLVFYIRQQKSTSTNYKYGQGNEADLDATISASKAASIISGMQNFESVASSFGGDILSKVNSGINSISGATGIDFSSSIKSPANIFGDVNMFINGSGTETEKIIDESVKKITGGSLDFLKTTKLTTDAIALYMPDTLSYSYTQSYENANIGEEIAGKAFAAGQSVAESYQKGGTSEAFNTTLKTAAMLGGEALRNAFGNATGKNTAKLGFTAVTGAVTNPMLELIYTSPNFRTFQFEFIFYPRDEKEAYEVQKILERFRFHQAPEIAGSGVVSSVGEGNVLGYLVPPSEFDIRFYYAGAQNPNIPPIATCVLTSIDINYAPNGWSAYEIPGENKPKLGRTGMPTAVQLILQFQETTYLTKSDYNSELAIGSSSL